MKRLQMASGVQATRPLSTIDKRACDVSVWAAISRPAPSSEHGGIGVMSGRVASAPTSVWPAVAWSKSRARAFTVWTR
jgi:hypothetical protein